MMRSGHPRRRLRWLLLALLIGVTIPSAMIITQAFRQLQFESFHAQRSLAESLTQQIDRQLQDRLAREAARAVDDYRFALSVTEGAVQLSPLAGDAAGGVPGLVGYFQLDESGRFSTPRLPFDEQVLIQARLAPEEIARRRAKEDSLRKLLAEDSVPDIQKGNAADDKRLDLERPLADSASAPPSTYRSNDDLDSLASGNRARNETDDAFDDDAIANQQIFEKLSRTRSEHEDTPYAADASSYEYARAPLDTVRELKLEQNYAEQSEARLAKRKSRAQRKTDEAGFADATPAREAQKPAPANEPAASAPAFNRIQADRERAGLDTAVRDRIEALRTDVGPFRIARLNATHFVVFREVWRAPSRLIQGFVVQLEPLVQGIAGSAFYATTLAETATLVTAFDGDILAVFRPDASSSPSMANAGDNLLYQSRLSAPAAELELIFSISELPYGPGAAPLAWMTGVLGCVLVAGFLVLYRTGLTQIATTEQQQEFVSAVTHELKTPLTSIRMYGEILKAGWADDAKKSEYYNFIHTEAERLSRLIDNVLELTRVSRGDGAAARLERRQIGPLLDDLTGKLQTPVGAAGRTLNVHVPDTLRNEYALVDADALTQILLNLVDNAIKFSASGNASPVDLTVTRDNDVWQLSVRDYGPGIAKDQLRNIFKLFYRPENELTRETIGTGIGLALVRELTDRMQGSVDVVNKEPGAEFRVRLPLDPAPAD